MKQLPKRNKNEKFKHLKLQMGIKKWKFTKVKRKWKKLTLQKKRKRIHKTAKFVKAKNENICKFDREDIFANLIKEKLQNLGKCKNM